MDTHLYLSPYRHSTHPVVIMFFLILYSLAFFPFAVCHEESQFCLPWSNIEKQLNKEESFNCTRNLSCLGISCFIHRFGTAIHGILTLEPCGNSPSLMFAIDSPNWNVPHWSKRFYHGDTFKVTDRLGGVFDLQKVKDTFVIGLTLHLSVGSDMSSPIWKFITMQPPVTYPLFSNIVVPIPPCGQNLSHHNSSAHNISTTAEPSVNAVQLVSKALLDEYTNCSISNKSCPLNELCQQLNVTSLEGVCICVPNYVRDQSGKCIYTPTIVTTTETPGGHPDTPSTPSNKSLLLTAVLVPLVVIILMIGAVYATIKFRICQRMRRRLRVQVYEHVLLGQDEDEEESEGNLSNPVA